METATSLRQGYLLAYEIACLELGKRDCTTISVNANVLYDQVNHTFSLKFLNKDYQIDGVSGEVRRSDSQAEVNGTIKVLLLHYLLNAQNKPLSGRLISFKELKNGAPIYDQTFYQRAILPLLRTFEKNFDGFYRAASLLAGNTEEYGDASVAIKVLPLVPITYVLWKGDEEVAAAATILFDDSITSFLPAEDIVWAASFGTYELMALAREMDDQP
jgi:Domain of unknown function (DUF3786)